MNGWTKRSVDGQEYQKFLQRCGGIARANANFMGTDTEWPYPSSEMFLIDGCMAILSHTYIPDMFMGGSE